MEEIAKVYATEDEAELRVMPHDLVKRIVKATEGKEKTDINLVFTGAYAPFYFEDWLLPKRLSNPDGKKISIRPIDILGFYIQSEGYHIEKFAGDLKNTFSLKLRRVVN